jgi:hypothetical protein
MDDQNAQVGWTEAQWNRVREEVLRAWQRVRIAGSFLPAYGPLPPSTQVIPSEVFNSDGTVDDDATAALLEISLPVSLTRQEIREEDLSSALLQFRRRASQVGQLEDWYIFNGTYPSGGFPDPDPAAAAGGGGAALPSREYLPDVSFLKNLMATDWPIVKGAPKPIATATTQVEGLLRRNPGALGLIEGTREVEEERDDQGRPVQVVKERWSAAPQPDNTTLIAVIVTAINSLERNGFVAPYVCVFGRGPFQAAHRPVGTSIAFPRDRLEPLIGRELLHASAIDIVPRPVRGYEWSEDVWQNRGVLLSLTGDGVDLAIAAEATPEFRQVDVRGRYVFSVFERFALRIKDPKAIVPLKFRQ